MSGMKLQSSIGKGLALVHFYLPWGASCRVQAPIVENLAKRYRGAATVTRFNLIDNCEVADNLSITGVPTLVVFRDGEEIQRFVGTQSFETLSEALDKAME